MKQRFIRSRDEYIEPQEKEGSGFRRAISAYGVVGLGGGIVEGGINLMRSVTADPFGFNRRADEIASLATGRDFESSSSVVNEMLRDLRAQFEDDIQTFKMNEGIDENAFLNITSELMRGVVSTVVNPVDRVIGGASANIVTGIGKKLGMKALQSQAVKIASGVVADSALNVYYSDRFVRDGYSKQDFVKDLGSSIIASYVIQGGFKGLSKILRSSKMKSISSMATDNVATIKRKATRARNLETISKVNDIADTLEKSGMPITEADRSSLIKNTYDTTRIDKYSSVADTEQFRAFQNARENQIASANIKPKLKKSDQSLIQKGELRVRRLAKYEEQLETKTAVKGRADLKAKIEKTKKELDEIDSKLKESGIGVGEKNEVLEEYNKAEKDFNMLLNEKFGEDYNVLDMMQELDNVMDAGEVSFNAEKFISLTERELKENPLEIKGNKIDTRSERAYNPEVIKGISETNKNVQELDKILNDIMPKVEKTELDKPIEEAVTKKVVPTDSKLLDSKSRTKLVGDDGNINSAKGKVMYGEQYEKLKEEGIKPIIKAESELKYLNREGNSDFITEKYGEEVTEGYKEYLERVASLRKNANNKIDMMNVEEYAVKHKEIFEDTTTKRVEEELSLGKMMLNCVTGGKISG